MKKLLLLICLFGFPFYVYSQNITIKGKITDATDKLPIDNVNISVRNTNKGCTSNDKGRFEITAPLPIVLEISHIAYQKQVIFLTKDDVKLKRKIDLNINLSSKTIGLEGVTVYAKSNNQLESAVCDFEVSDSLIYVISKSSPQKYLQIYTLNDCLKDIIPIPNECTEIKYDYSNTLAVKKRKKDEYYKVLYDKSKEIKLKKHYFDNIERGILLTAYDINNYSPDGLNINRTAYTNAVTLMRGNSKCKFFYSYTYRNKGITLYKLFEQDNKLKYTIIYYALYDVNDWLKYPSKNKESIKRIESINYEINHRLFSTPIPGGPVGDLFSYYSMLGNSKIPVYFGQIGNNVVIINIDKGVLYLLSETGLPLYEVKLDDEIVKNNYPIECLISNQEQTRCFIRYNQFGSIRLREIDLKTGKYINKIKIPNNAVDKIRIVGNYVYYTANRNIYNRDEKWLYKLKID